MIDQLRFLNDRIERLEQDVGDIRRRLQNCLRVADRPEDALVLARSVAECLAKRLVEALGIPPPPMLDACLKTLEKPEVMSRGLVPSEIITILHMVRVMGNKATHDAMRIAANEEDVYLVLQSILRVVEWYFSAFERGPKLERPSDSANAPAAAADRAGVQSQPGERDAATRRAAHEELWRRIEEIHLKIRTEEVEKEAFSSLLREVNAYIFRNSLCFDVAVHELTNAYLVLLMEVRHVVTETEDDEITTAFHDTRPLPPSAIRRVRRLHDLWTKAQRIRAELWSKVEAVRGDESVPVRAKRRWWFW
jgi:hypothetical protein